MLTKLSFLLYLSRETYKSICQTLNLDDSDQKTGINQALFPNQLISRINAYNILYQQFGHIWFLDVDIDFTKLEQPQQNFEEELFREYEKLFGAHIAKNLPTLENTSCGYAEFTNTISVPSTNTIIQNFTNAGHPIEKIDERYWQNYKKPTGTNATLDLFISKIDDNQLKTLATCHGTAMKKRIKDKAFHIATGVSAAKVLDEQTEQDIMAWLYKKHNIK